MSPCEDAPQLSLMNSSPCTLPTRAVWLGACARNPICMGFPGVWELDKQLLCVCD